MMEHNQYPAGQPDVHGGEAAWQDGHSGGFYGEDTSGQGLAPVVGGQSPQMTGGGMSRSLPVTTLPGFVPPPAQMPPGAIENPCCMGSEAAEMLEVLTGFAEEEAAEQRYYQALARQAPAWAKQSIRELAADCGSHLRTLESVCYLITGQCYRPLPLSGPVLVGRWCQALREQYHASACSGLNYARAADGTTDPCLSRLLQELSRGEYHQADVLLGLLERAL